MVLEIHTLKSAVEFPGGGIKLIAIESAKDMGLWAIEEVPLLVFQSSETEILNSPDEGGNFAVIGSFHRSATREISPSRLVLFSSPRGKDVLLAL